VAAAPAAIAGSPPAADGVGVTPPRVDAAGGEVGLGVVAAVALRVAAAVGFAAAGFCSAVGATLATAVGASVAGGAVEREPGVGAPVGIAGNVGSAGCAASKRPVLRAASTPNPTSTSEAIHSQPSRGPRRRVVRLDCGARPPRCGTPAEYRFGTPAESRAECYKRFTTGASS